MSELKRIPTVKQIIRIIEEMAPGSLALPGDPTGLQCGETGRPVRRMMLSLDASPEAVRQAANFKANLLFTHHPLLFEPLTPGNISGPAGRALAMAVREDLAVYSAHTNLDAAPGGINSSLAGLIGLRDVRFLQVSGPGPLKFVIFVPTESLEQVKEAAFQAGAGVIGNYSRCSFAVSGSGTFRPEGDASPAVGRPGRDERAREFRLEMSVPESAREAVLEAVRRAHPYEEPAVDIYPMAEATPRAGFGIAGTLLKAATVGEVAARLTSKLKPASVRLVGKKGRKIQKVAVCAGSGASLMDAAVRTGAQLYVTGDIKYHDARKAEEEGLDVLDIGHFAAERYGFVQFGKLLDAKLAGSGFQVEIKLAKEKDPFVPVL